MRLLAAITLLPALVLANILTAPAQDGPSRSGAAPVEEELISKEKRTWELYKNKDVKALAELTGEDFYDIYPAGEVVGKKQYLQDVLEIEVKDYSLSDFKVTMLNGGAAVVVYKAKAHAVVKGKELKSEVAVTSGWARRGGRWLNVFYRENALELNGRRLL
ncbi:MAG TPA: nuclear transport factor 2 family protein [Pyrinomonadaceae bacterium]|jgi:ketosteroid isomerase-like protein